jgi:hypothetical protein
MAWNLHIVGKDTADQSAELAADIVAAVESYGHQLTSAVLTDDSGQTVLNTVAVTPPPEESVEEPPPEEVPEDTPPEAPTA